MINGNLKGKCPINIEVAAGTLHLVAVKKVDVFHERVYEEDIRIRDGEKKFVEINLVSRLTAAGQRQETERLRTEAEAAQHILLSLKEQGFEPDNLFKDCQNCPEMVTVPLASQPFAIGKYEVTFAEWDACVADGGCGGYSPNDQSWGRGNLPVMNINWSDAKQYVQWLSQKTGKHYRLPSGAEWKYAAQAGAATAYSFGDDGSQLGSYAWYAANSGHHTHPVGEKKPNAFGLYDMHGNVWEWVEDCRDKNCSRHIVRGGSWYGSHSDARSASFSGVDTGDRHYDIGFRVARTIP